MRTGAAFNRRVVLRVFSEHGLIAVSNGYRIKDFLRIEYNAIFVKNGASSPILADLIPSNTWPVSIEDTSRCLGVAQELHNFCKSGGDDPTKGIVQSKGKVGRCSVIQAEALEAEGFITTIPNGTVDSDLDLDLSD